MFTVPWTEHVIRHRHTLSNFPHIKHTWMHVHVHAQTHMTTYTYIHTQTLTYTQRFTQNSAQDFSISNQAIKEDHIFFTTFNLSLSKYPEFHEKCENSFSQQFTGLLHSLLPYISTITNIWVSSCYFTTEWLHKFYLSRNCVTLSEHQSLSNWNQTVKFSSV